MMLLCVFVVSILNVTLAFEKTVEIFTGNYNYRSGQKNNYYMLLKYIISEFL